jgi:sulfoxide reductase heme-binding subunit YedZ
LAFRPVLNRVLQHGWVRGLLVLAGSVPALFLLYGAFTNQLGANPAEALVRGTGDWTLRMLCAVLAVTPLRVQLGLPALARWRRTLGLWVYAYAVLHLLCYAWFDMGFEVQDIAQDIAKRPFILVGFSALVLLTPLAATSWNRAIRWLGAARWQALHRLVYAVAGLAVLHFFWMRAGKHNFAEVAAYAAVLGSLLGWRLWRKLASARQATRAAVGETRVDQGAR